MFRSSMVLVALVCAACGSNSPGGPSGGSSTGGSSTSGGSGGALPYAGNVTLDMNSEAGPVQWTASASFVTSASLPAGCVPSASTPCCFYGGAATGLDAGAQSPVSAGAITVTDGTTTLATLAFRSDAGVADYGSLSSATTPGLRWSPGDTLTITAAGSANGVDAFSATVTAPPSLQNVTPTLSLTPPPVSVSISTALTLTWTALPASSVPVDISLNVSTGSATGLISCETPLSAGTFTIPANLMSMLPSGANGVLSLTPTLRVAPSSPPANATTLIQLQDFAVAGSVTTTP